MKRVNRAVPIVLQRPFLCRIQVDVLRCIGLMVIGQPIDRRPEARVVRVIESQRALLQNLVARVALIPSEPGGISG
jgi:hypothetical protein